MIVFGRCYQHTITFSDFSLQIQSLGQTWRAFKILVVERYVFKRHHVHRHGRRDSSSQNVKDRSTEGGLPKISRDTDSSKLVRRFHCEPQVSAFSISRMQNHHSVIWQDCAAGDPYLLRAFCAQFLRTAQMSLVGPRELPLAACSYGSHHCCAEVCCDCGLAGDVLRTSFGKANPRSIKASLYGCVGHLQCHTDFLQ